MTHYLSNLSDKRKTLLILSLAFCFYFPFIFLGYGGDCDNHGVANSAHTLLTEHRYVPSRYPGYFVHEATVAFLFLFDGSVASNFGMMIFSLLTIFFFLKICAHYQIPHSHLLALFMIIQPFYWVNSTCTIDYLEALALLFIGFILQTKDRYILAGILYGLAVGTRLSSCLFVTALVAAHFLTRQPGTLKVLVTGTIATILGTMSYIPSYIFAGHTFAFWTYYIGDWTWQGYLVRYIYKNIYFWGLQTFLAFVCLAPYIYKGFKIYYQEYNRFIIMLSLLMILAFQALFLKIPIERSYLLPMLPFVLILLGIALKDHVRAIILLIIIQFTFNFIDFPFANPDIPSHATTATLGLRVQSGYFIQDLLDRIKYPD